MNPTHRLMHWIEFLGATSATRGISLLFILALAGCALLISVTHYPEFDGAMNFQVSKNLVAGNGYTTDYTAVKNNIQTGPPLIVPTSLWFALFGITKFSCQLSNFLYFLFLIATMLAIGRATLPMPPWYPLLALFAIPELFKYALFGYGEAIAALFTLLGFIALGPGLTRGGKGLIMAGVFFGLAGMTKTLSLVSLIALFSGLAPASLFILPSVRRRDLVRRWSVVAALLVLLPLSFEGLKLSQEGWPTYSEQFQKLSVTIEKNQGFGSLSESGLGSVVSRFGDGAENLAGEFHLPPGVLYVLIFLVCGLTIYFGAQSRDPLVRFAAVGLVAYFLLGLLWWQVMTGQQWWRRLYQFWLIITPCVAFVLYRSVEGLKELIARRRGSREFEWLGLALVLGLLMYPVVISLTENVQSATNRTLGDPDWVDAQIDSMLVPVRGLPQHSPVLVDYWWQEPIISLFSGRGRDFHDFRDEDVVVRAFREGRPVQFLLTYHEKKYDSTHYQSLYNLLKPGIVARTDDYALCRISPGMYCQLVTGLIPADSVCSYMADMFSRPEAHATTSHWSGMVDFAKGEFNDQMCAGWYPREFAETGSYRWMWRRASILFPPAATRRRLVARVYPLLDQVDGGRQTIEILLNGSLVLRKELTDNRSPITLAAPLPIGLADSSRVATVTFVVDKTIASTAADNRELGLIVTQVTLE